MKLIAAKEGKGRHTAQLIAAKEAITWFVGSHLREWSVGAIKSGKIATIHATVVMNQIHNTIYKGNVESGDGI